MASVQVRVRYRPANTVADLHPDVRATGRKAMDAKLLDDSTQEVADAAAREIAAAAQATVRRGSGRLADSIHVVEQTPLVFDGNPRRAAAVTAHGGIYTGARDPESSIAVVQQFGNTRVRGNQFLSRAGQPFHTEKRPG